MVESLSLSDQLPRALLHGTGGSGLPGRGEGGEIGHLFERGKAGMFAMTFTKNRRRTDVEIVPSHAALGPPGEVITDGNNLEEKEEKWKKRKKKQIGSRGHYGHPLGPLSPCSPLAQARVPRG